MPIPIPDTEDDKALWVRAEQLAEELLDFHDRAPVMAQDDVRTHQGYLEKGESAEHEFFERLFLEAAARCASRWKHGWSISKKGGCRPRSTIGPRGGGAVRECHGRWRRQRLSGLRSEQGNHRRHLPRFGYGAIHRRSRQAQAAIAVDLRGVGICRGCI